MKLEDIGFYTLSDARALSAGRYAPLHRCELVLTSRCNFKCPYCQGLPVSAREDLTDSYICRVLRFWADEGLLNVRFSGGEPTLSPWLRNASARARLYGTKRIAISTNGSADLDFYKVLMDYGVDDFSISLDSGCCSIGTKLTGGIEGSWEKTVKNIEELSKVAYVTVGMVFTEDNIPTLAKDIEFVHNLGVADIRIISAAQYNKLLDVSSVRKDILDKHPILRYRINNYASGRPIRGLRKEDCGKCHLVLDDMAVAGKYHYPCIIYLRQFGEPIGEIGPNMRDERLAWFEKHNSFTDQICRDNCLDVCVDYNNTVERLHKEISCQKSKLSV